MERALNAAPWLAPVLAVVILMRREIGALMMSGRADRAADAAMSTLVGQFDQNLKHFERLSSNSEKWLDEQRKTNVLIEGLHETQRSILTEMVRGSNGKGG